MVKIVFLLSLLPLLAMFFCKKWFVDKSAKESKAIKINQSPSAIIQKILTALGQEHVELKSSKRRWSGNPPVGDDWISLPIEVKASEAAPINSAFSHGEGVLHYGLYILLQKDPLIVKRRNWAVRFGFMFPIFVTIIIIFACAVGKLPAFWGISVATLSLGIASCAQLFTLMANLQAVGLATVILEKKRIYPRLHEEEAVIRAAKSAAWSGLIPGVLARFV